MESEPRRLHRWSWLFIAAGSVRALVVPLAGAVFVSQGALLSRLELLSLVFLLPAFVYALLKQRVYHYHFTDTELVVSDGLLTKNVRRINYERIHNVSLVRNPIHRLLGAATAQIETAAGGKPEASLRVVSLQAAQELKHFTLGDQAGAEGAPQDGATDADDAPADQPLLQVPDSELLRLGLISNRGFLVVAAALGAGSQMQWWEQDWFTRMDWQGMYDRAHTQAPGWSSWLLESGVLIGGALALLLGALLLLLLIRVFSMAWYLIRYKDFTLRRKAMELRTEYGLWPSVSSLIPVRRVQLVTVNASLLHRWCRRVSIDLETAGATDTNAGFEGASGSTNTRQWLAPIIAAEDALDLVRQALPDIDLNAVQWRPIDQRAARRIVNRIALALTPITIGIAALFGLTPIALSAWHALWLPAFVLTTATVVSRRWVRHTGYALTSNAILFRSGWIGRQISAVRFANAQTATLRQSPFDRRKGMASVAVDTAGAGSLGHRVHIPFLAVDEARAIMRRLYEETRDHEFRW